MTPPSTHRADPCAEQDPRTQEHQAAARIARSRLARSTTAMECVRVAHELSGGEVELAVLESDHAFVVSSTTTAVLQPRALCAAEVHLAASTAACTEVDGITAFAVRLNDERPVAALVLERPAGDDNHNAMLAVCRMLAGELRRADDTTFERSVLDGLRDAVVIVDDELSIRWANAAVTTLLSTSPSELIGVSALDLLHPDDVAPALEAVARLARGLEMYRLTVRVRRATGTFESVEITGIDRSSDDNIGGLVLSLRNADREAERGLTNERVSRMSGSILHQLRDGVVVLDEHGAVSMINRAARRLFGIDGDTPAASLDTDQLNVFDLDGNPTSLAEHGAFERGDPDGSPQIVSSGDELRHVVMSQAEIHDSSGRPLGAAFVFQDITATRRATKELERQALHDQMTGLANRRYLEAFLHGLPETATSLVALFIDLDGFKLINDVHGHRVGDEILRLAAQRLRSQARETDLVVRQGGDEFLLLLPDPGEDATVAAIADRVLVELRQTYVVGAEHFDLTASIGIARDPSPGGDDRILRQADLALYAAKDRGRNRVEWFDERLATDVDTEERQRRAARAALDRRTLEVHLQPVVNAEIGAVVGFESLARCPTERGRLVSPGGFAPPIQASGLMWEIDRAAFRLSCAAADALSSSAGVPVPSVACNLSAVSLQQTGLVDFILETTHDAGVLPAQICLEITESAAFDGSDETINRLVRLREQGFRLALDDFGTGYSSLAHLRDLPLDIVKVDKSFTRSLTRPQSAERAIAQSIVSLSADLGFEVVAEGVETAEQLLEARAMGFTHIQGWYYAAAMPLPDAQRYLAESYATDGPGPTLHLPQRR